MKISQTALSILFGLVLIGIVIFGSYMFSRDSQQKFALSGVTTFQESLNSNYEFSVAEYAKNKVKKDSNIVLVDLRSKFEFNKGHLPYAKNIYIASVLKDDNINYFNTLKKANKTAVLYGDKFIDSDTAYMLLKQMGVDNIKVLQGCYTHYASKTVTELAKTEHVVPDNEKAIADITDYIKTEKSKDLERIKKEKEQKAVVVKRKSVRAVSSQTRPVVGKKNTIKLTKKPVVKKQAVEEDEEEDEGC